MKILKDFIESGILEMYVADCANEEESKEVEVMISKHPEVRIEIYEIAKTLELYAMALSVPPKQQVKDLLLRRIMDSENAIKNKFVLKSNWEVTAKTLNRIFNPSELSFYQKDSYTNSYCN